MKKEINVTFSLERLGYDKIAFETNGTLEIKKDYTRIIFDEVTDDVAKTVVDIYINDELSKNKVIIKRLGQIKTTMEYILNEETQALLKTDFGYEFSMQTYTSVLEIKNDSLKIRYQTESDIDQNLEHEFTLNWTDK